MRRALRRAEARGVGQGQRYQKIVDDRVLDLNLESITDLTGKTRELLKRQANYYINAINAIGRDHAAEVQRILDAAREQKKSDDAARERDFAAREKELEAAVRRADANAREAAEVRQAWERERDSLRSMFGRALQAFSGNSVFVDFLQRGIAHYTRSHETFVQLEHDFRKITNQAEKGGHG